MNQANANNDNTTGGTLDDWERRLLAYPNAKETKRFIDQYHSNLVTSEVFFKVAQEMLDDSRPEMKKLGVMCVGLSPSVLSFQMLAQIYKTERSDSDVRRYADQFVDVTYTQDLSNLGVLEAVMRSTDSSYATILAAQKLDVAINRYMGKGHPTGGSTRPGATSTTEQTNHYASYFQRFYGVLTSLLQSPDSAVSEQARQTLATLQTYLPNTSAGSQSSVYPDGAQAS
jgi:hypothetical protein